MKRLIVLMMLISSTALGADFTVGYDYYKRPGSGNNYDDGQGFTVGFEHGIYNDLKGSLGVLYITDIDFPSVDDPKGSFGELRGYAAIYSLIYHMRYNDNLSFNLSAGAGPALWDFRENPFLQDHGVKVSVDPSLVLKTGVGVEYKTNNDWTLSANVGWLDTNVGKDARDPSGKEWNILDSDNTLGLQYITYRIQAKKRF